MPRGQNRISQMSLPRTNSPTDPARLPPDTQTADRITPVPPQRLHEALQRLLTVGGRVDHNHVQRFIDFAHANDIPLHAMWALEGDDGSYMHTVLAVPSPGRTAMFFASHPANAEDVQPIGSIIHHAAEQIAQTDVHLAQALLDPTSQLDRDMFRAGNFSELAYLSYMQRPVPRSTRSLEVTFPENITLKQYDESLQQQLISILEATYQDTLDCPALRGLRQTQDILRGHQSTGEFDPELWTLLYVNDTPAGALLLNPSPQQDSVELVYLGLAPQARGKGLGRSLLRHGLAKVAGRHRTITLAVDEQNHPALALYRAEKFRSVLRRVAMIRSIRKPA